MYLNLSFFHPVPDTSALMARNSIQPPENSKGGAFGWCLAYFRDADGNRLYLGNFDADGLNCNNWNGEDANGNIGVFALMVKKDKKQNILAKSGCFVFS